MMLRSSSTPALGSLLSSFSDSPQQHPTPNIPHQNCTKLPCNKGGFHNVAKPLLHSPSVAEIKTMPTAIRRVQSEGNLKEMGNASYDVDDLTFSNQYAKKLAHKPILETIPSLSRHKLETGLKKVFDSDDEEEEIELQMETSDVSSYGDMGFQGEGKIYRYGDHMSSQGEGKLYLATGIGVQPRGCLEDGVYGGGCGGGGGSYRPVDFNGDGGDSRGLSMEEYYRRMLEKSPGNPLFLRNYAHFLYQKKGDLDGAEEYYSRAILSDPEDGEILCQYAKLIWELHHDKERAAAYFERAIQASSEDSHINASYASFLWEIEEDEDEDDDKEKAAGDSNLFHHEIMAASTTVV